MNLQLNQENQNSSIQPINNCQRRPAEKYICQLLPWKIILKCNCRHVPADGIVRTQNEFEILNGGRGDRKKCKGNLTHTFYAMKRKWEASDQFLGCDQKLFDSTLANLEESCQGFYRLCSYHFGIKNIPSSLICNHLPCRLKICIIVFGFLCAKGNSKEI